MSIFLIKSMELPIGSFILAFFGGTKRKEIDTTLLNEREIFVPFDPLSLSSQCIFSFCNNE
uniref:Uncharacterized protein n=1 Tax=Romanomermis culicivorax TaxID=13658 RepID=A0A915L238_ROMCU